MTWSRDIPRRRKQRRARAPITVIVICAAQRPISDGATKLQQNRGTTWTRATGAVSRCLARSGTISRRCYRGRPADNAEVRGVDGACSFWRHVPGTCSVGDTGLATTAVNIRHFDICLFVRRKDAKAYHKLSLLNFEKTICPDVSNWDGW